MLSIFRSSHAESASQRVWGDGLLDCSLTTLWYPSDWTSIDADELLLLMPSLRSSKTTAGADAEPAHHIQRKFVTLIKDAALKLASPATGGSDSGQALDRIRQSGVLNAFLARGSPSQTSGSGEASRVPKMAPLRTEERNAWLYELFILACIDRMLLDAMPPSQGIIPTLLEKSELPDALVATVHTQINAGYVYPQYAYAHEMLMTGAWLGLVAAGRPAYMPPPVGEVLIAYLDRRLFGADQSEARVASILSFYAGLAGGNDRLVGVARKVCGAGSPILVRPVRLSGAVAAPVTSWNERLASLIAGQLANAAVSNDGI